MHSTITPLKIIKREENQVTTSEIYVPQRRATATRKYHPDGLMSERIFGRFNTCKCGKLTYPGFCEECGTRVVDPSEMPSFFIDLTIPVVKYNADFAGMSDVKSLLLYEAYLVKRENNSFEVKKVSEEPDDDLFNLSPDKVLIGLEAARLINNKVDKWAQFWTTDFIQVPHPFMRPSIKLDSGNEVLSSLTKYLQEILVYLNDFDLGYELPHIFSKKDDLDDVLFDLMRCQRITEIYHSFCKEIYERFCVGKKSWLHQNLIGHKVTGAIRGTAINRFDVDEDIVLIGDTFIETLYPYLFKKNNGDMAKINQHFIENEERVMVSRQPTISELSVQVLKPRVASIYPFATIEDEEIDTAGIRTIGVNPIIMDGLAGDFDGDTLFVVSIYSKRAKQEAESMLASKNYMNNANGEVRNGIPQELAYIA